MKRLLMAILTLGLFAALAQAGTLLQNTVPTTNILTDSAAFTYYDGGWIDPVNGGVFTAPADGSDITNWEVWLVAQQPGSGGVINTMTDPYDNYTTQSLGAATAHLFFSDVTAATPTWTEATGAGTWNANFSRYYYADNTNYYSTTYSPGNYLPMYQLGFTATPSNPQISFTPGTTYAWAVTFDGGLQGALLADTISACNAQYNAVSNPITCDVGGGSVGNMIGWGTVTDGGLVADPSFYSGPAGALYDTNYQMSPEPGTWLLIAAGAGALAIARRRRA